MSITIVRYEDMPDRFSIAPRLDEIFFESSNTQSFANDAARAAFRERWLGRYLTHYPQWFYVARSGDEVMGYLAGCIDDPARLPLFDDIAHYKTFARLTARYPAHLHVNLGAAYRSAGAGSLLVQRFCDDAASAGACGVHVMTSKDARNVAFYARNGFHEAAVSGVGASVIVFLARDL